MPLNKKTQTKPKCKSSYITETQKYVLDVTKKIMKYIFLQFVLINIYLPKPFMTGKMWQKDLNEVKLVWIQSFPSYRLVTKSRLKKLASHTIYSSLEREQMDSCDNK